MRTGHLPRLQRLEGNRDVLNGVIPRRTNVEGNLPINLQKNEEVVWVFPSCEYLEDTTRREYVGHSQGMSFRIMKGVYYRVGGFKGRPIDRTERVHIDTGIVGPTNEHIFFAVRLRPSACHTQKSFLSNLSVTESVSYGTHQAPNRRYSSLATGGSHIISPRILRTFHNRDFNGQERDARREQLNRPANRSRPAWRNPRRQRKTEVAFLSF